MLDTDFLLGELEWANDGQSADQRRFCGTPAPAGTCGQVDGETTSTEMKPCSA